MMLAASTRSADDVRDPTLTEYYKFIQSVTNSDKRHAQSYRRLGLSDIVLNHPNSNVGQ